MTCNLRHPVSLHHPVSNVSIEPYFMCTLPSRKLLSSWVYSLNLMSEQLDFHDKVILLYTIPREHSQTLKTQSVFHWIWEILLSKAYTAAIFCIDPIERYGLIDSSKHWQQHNKILHRCKCSWIWEFCFWWTSVRTMINWNVTLHSWMHNQTHVHQTHSYCVSTVRYGSVINVHLESTRRQLRLHIRLFGVYWWTVRSFTRNFWMSRLIWKLWTRDHRGSAVALLCHGGEGVCKAGTATCTSRGGSGLSVQCMVCCCLMMFLLLHLFIDSSNEVVKLKHLLLWTQNLPWFNLFFPCVHITLPDAVYCCSNSQGRDSV